MKVAIALAIVLGQLELSRADAAPVLRAAEARVTFTSSTACTVELELTVEGATEIEHRLEVAPGARVELRPLRGAAQAGAPRDIGRTRALTLRPEGASYTISYQVDQPPSRAGRCPLWLPTVPADGRSKSVRLVARIPAGATAAGTMPTFAWTGEEGTATVGHLPTFVRVPFAQPGAPAPLDIARAMDVFSIAVLVLATLAWAGRHGVRHH